LTNDALPTLATLYTQLGNDTTTYAATVGFDFTYSSTTAADALVGGNLDTALKPLANGAGSP